MCDIVILTPSFNRRETLPRLYDSLKGQIDNNFTWVIVDDGSLDGTASLVREMLNEDIIDIKYIFQENGGKARALNTGFAECQKALVVMIVDSDDYLLPTAVSTVKKYWDKYGDIQDIGGFLFHYKTLDGEVIKPKSGLINSDQVMTIYQYNGMYGKHDGCICYINKVTKEYRYPEYVGEKYVGPTVLQMEMADNYKIVYSPELVGVAEYQVDGLTKSGRLLRLRNPLGMIHYCKLMMSSKGSLMTQFKYAISIWPYARIANKSFLTVLREVKRPLMLTVTYLPGKLVYYKWKKYLP
ncbi:glycosyltransferase family 2 protein [Halalkalibacter hemicellulosilyticus]|uniref:Glycosyltransferase n=1 Tax=Halalkalibacter hemicellulosilyticusJCM 9152 TaxID=1236971 RepID=W4QGY9_9BACI|nr:glycosyltransferase family A protein [Halalkalibacter hemicellulosilyticus]GAE31351.1 glycosyltransferase [Halalkalibacter hemicellulosilyticusJCM 9152]